MRYTSTCLALLQATIIGCGVGYPQETPPPEPAQDAAKEAAGVLADNDASWIAKTKIAKRLVALGFVKQKDSYIYDARMSFGDFKKNFGKLPLRPSLSTAFDEWVRTTNIEGNYTVVRLEDTKYARLDTPPDKATVAVSVNLFLIRRPTISVGSPMNSAHASLLHLGASEITATVETKFNGDRPGKRWSRWYLLPDKTCLLLRVEEISKPRSKPLAPRIRAIVLGDEGKGYSKATDWTNPERNVPATLSLNRYRKELK